MLPAELEAMVVIVDHDENSQCDCRLKLAGWRRKERHDTCQVHHKDEEQERRKNRNVFLIVLAKQTEEEVLDCRNKQFHGNLHFAGDRVNHDVAADLEHETDTDRDQDQKHDLLAPSLEDMANRHVAYHRTADFQIADNGNDRR